jgi:hypothetical protein
MQITLDLPDDVYWDAQAVAKQQSRSLASVVLDLIRSARTKSSQPPDAQGAPHFTVAENDHKLEADCTPSGPLAMLGYARQFQTGIIPSTDEIMRELRAGDRD